MPSTRSDDAFDDLYLAARLGTAHLRIARPTDALAALVTFYRDGLALDVLDEFRTMRASTG